MSCQDPSRNFGMSPIKRPAPANACNLLQPALQKCGQKTLSKVNLTQSLVEDWPVPLKLYRGFACGRLRLHPFAGVTGHPMTHSPPSRPISVQDVLTPKPKP